MKVRVKSVVDLQLQVSGTVRASLSSFLREPVTDSARARRGVVRARLIALVLARPADAGRSAIRR